VPPVAVPPLAVGRGEVSVIQLRKPDGSLTRTGCLWIGTAMLGVLVAGVSLLAVLDPVGTKSADDADPFGTPPSRSTSLAWFGTGVFMIAWPLLLRRRRDRAPSDTSSSNNAGG
jgi:hypothetical protein